MDQAGEEEQRAVTSRLRRRSTGTLCVFLCSFDKMVETNILALVQITGHLSFLQQLYPLL